MELDELIHITEAVRRGEITLDADHHSEAWEIGFAVIGVGGGHVMNRAWNPEAGLKPGDLIVVNDHCRELVRTARSLVGSGVIENLVASRAGWTKEDEQAEKIAACDHKRKIEDDAGMLLCLGCQSRFFAGSKPEVCYRCKGTREFMGDPCTCIPISSTSDKKEAK